MIFPDFFWPTASLMPDQPQETKKKAKFLVFLKEFGLYERMRYFLKLPDGAEGETRHNLITSLIYTNKKYDILQAATITATFTFCYAVG